MWDFKGYRDSLKMSIKRNGFNKEVIYINAQDWNPKGDKDPRSLYQEDHIHLTSKGYLLLDSCIAAYITGYN